MVKRPKGTARSILGRTSQYEALGASLETVGVILRYGIIKRLLMGVAIEADSMVKLP